MSMDAVVGCEQFDERAEDLALGFVEEPLRSRLLAHAGACPACRSLLDGLGSVVDRLLLVAPQEEPPAGFESRALARIGAPPVVNRERARVPLWAAAVAALVLGGFGFIAARRWVEPSPASGGPTAAIVAASGQEVGSVQLVAEPAPHVLVAISKPRPGPGVRNCELQRPDGSWVTVGSWEIADLASGIWAVGVDADLLGATAMRVTTPEGSVVATADFD